MLRDLAIFPLNTVLFPGGVLPLRVFEARYMDMVRECMASDREFGVCLITRGNEVGEAASHEDVGCTARIAGWDMEQLGLLNIRAIGGRRFRIVSRRVQKDGLIRADAEPLEPDADCEVPERFAQCAGLARRLADDLAAREPDPSKRLIEEPFRFDSAAWVSNRLCEFLPIPVRARQKLMELDDALARLSVVDRYLRDQKVIQG